MKALTISQPFASLIASGEKWVENRVWATDYRGPLAIHAGKGSQYIRWEELAKYPTGMVIAVADLVACLHVETMRECLWRKAVPAKLIAIRWDLDDIRRFLDHEHTEGPYGWVLANIRQVGPFSARGAQGLWECSHPGLLGQIPKRGTDGTAA